MIMPKIALYSLLHSTTIHRERERGECSLFIIGESSLLWSFLSKHTNAEVAAIQAELEWRERCVHTRVCV